MLPPKIGDGVEGSSWGGTKPAGAGVATGAAGVSGAAAWRAVGAREVGEGKARERGLGEEEGDRVAARRWRVAAEACVAMAMAGASLARARSARVANFFNTCKCYSVGNNRLLECSQR